MKWYDLWVELISRCLVKFNTCWKLNSVPNEWESCDITGRREW